MKQYSKNAPMPGTQAIVRAFKVLKALGTSPGGHGITELSGVTGLSKATVFRALAALEAEDMVAQRINGGPYSLGPGLIALGNSALSAMDLRTMAHNELATLTALSGETATLEVMVGSEVLILDEVQGRFLLGTQPEVGRRWPAHATSTGKLFLALMEQSVIPAHLEKCAPRTIVKKPELEAELARIRRKGYASAVEELEPDLIAVAAPVRNHTGDVIAALSINGPKTRLGPRQRRALIVPLCEAATRVSRRLGAVGSSSGALVDAQQNPKKSGAPVNAHG